MTKNTAAIRSRHSANLVEVVITKGTGTTTLYEGHVLGAVLDLGQARELLLDLTVALGAHELRAALRPGYEGERVLDAATVTDIAAAIKAERSARARNAARVRWDKAKDTP